MQRPSVDLPQPDSPTRPSVSPRASSRSTPSTARSTLAARPREPPADPPRSGKCIARPRTSSSGSATGDHRLAPRVLGADVVVDARGRAPAAERTQRELAARRSPPARTGSADGSGSPAGARRDRPARPGSRRGARACRRRRAPSAAGRACTGAAARGTPSRPVPVSTTWPAYMTATRWQVCAMTARSCETKTRLTPSSLAQRERAA